MTLENRVASLEQEVLSLRGNYTQLQDRTMDHEQRFDTLQTRWWKRLWFRMDGWPGQNNLNAEKRSRRPWHK